MNGSPLFRTIEPMPETSEMTDPMTDHGNDHRPHGRADLMRDLTAGESQCTARSKRTGQRCRLASMFRTPDMAQELVCGRGWGLVL